MRSHPSRHILSVTIPVGAIIMTRLLHFALAAATLLLASIVPPSVAADAEHKVARVSDFSLLGTQLREKNLPLLLMFSAEHCGYCVKLESDFLQPMLISGDYTERTLIRKLDISNYTKIRDFDGNELTPAEFADRYNVSVTPTVVFLDGHGNQLAPKRVGLTTPDFYAGYLDESIATAQGVLKSTQSMRAGVDQPCQQEC